MRSASALALLLGMLWLLAAAPAHAFPAGNQFDDDPLASAGGGGVHFTGSPDFAMATCSTCHQDGALQLGIQLNADDTSLFSAGYVPGQLYKLQVALRNETEGLQFNGPARCGDVPSGFVPCNSNAFALEADDAFGNVVGMLCPTTPSSGTCTPDKSDTTLLAADNSAIHTTGFLPRDSAADLPAGFENGATSWTFYWQAPPPGVGPVTFHIGAVDGNGGEGSDDVPQDTVGDDTAAAHIQVAESGASPLVSTTNGCALGRAGDSAFVVSLAALIGLGLLARGRRRSPNPLNRLKRNTP